MAPEADLAADPDPQLQQAAPPVATEAASQQDAEPPAASPTPTASATPVEPAVDASPRPPAPASERVVAAPSERVTAPTKAPTKARERPRSGADEIWDDLNLPVEPKVRAPSGAAPGRLPERRVVVIDDSAVPDAGEADPPAPNGPGSETGGSIGATLHDEGEEPKRRWRLFRSKGGE